MLYEIDITDRMFKNEAEFQKDYIKITNLHKGKEILDCFPIENKLESGMPDLILVNMNRQVSFIELKYARNNIITFERTQPSWYKRHRDLTIFVVSYRLKDKTIHTMDAEYALKNMKGLKVNLDA